jgi:hypothetical protein
MNRGLVDLGIKEKDVRERRRRREVRETRAKMTRRYGS